MLNKLLVTGTLALQVAAFGYAMDEDRFVDAGVCSDTCSYVSDGTRNLDNGKKWYCLAKDSCGKTYIPECGNTCFSHAVSYAEKLCAESSDDKDSCEVLSPKGGSCSNSREELVRKTKTK